MEKLTEKMPGPYQVMESLLNQIANEDVKLSKDADLFQKLRVEVANVVRYSLRQWQNAYEDAIDPYRYDREQLLDLYEQIEIDDHITALIDTIYNNILSDGFTIVDATGEEDPDAKELFERPWFPAFLAEAVDAMFHGFSGVQFTGITNGAYRGTKTIPRKHILPLENGVRYISNQDTKDIDFDDAKISPWTIFMFPKMPGDQYRLGKFNKVAKLFILKRENLQFWAIFNELFGIPYRVMKTQIKDATRRANAITAMETMTAASYSVIDEDDEVVFHNGVAGNNSGTFKEFLERCDKGMSKAIVGSTMVLEDGSSRSQGEVHERNTDAFVGSYQRIISDWINFQLMPKMIKLGMGLSAEHRFKWDDSESLSKKEWAEIFSTVSTAGFTIDAEFVTEMTGIPVESKSEPVNVPSVPSNDDPEDENDDPVPPEIQNRALFNKLLPLYGRKSAANAVKNIFKR